MSSDTAPPGTIPVEVVYQVTAVMTTAEAVSALGEPHRKLTGDEAAAEECDEVWIYLHDRRGKFPLKYPSHSYLYFINGQVASAQLNVQIRE